VSRRLQEFGPIRDDLVRLIANLRHDESVPAACQRRLRLVLLGVSLRFVPDTFSVVGEAGDIVLIALGLDLSQSAHGKTSSTGTGMGFSATSCSSIV
jgi:hypothetical protein